MARTGRRPGGPDTRSAILAAARAEFADKGYHQATIRSIAARTAVDPALVHHYFGTKEELFGVAVDLPIRPSDIDSILLSGGIGSIGRNVTTLFFSVWENPETRNPLLGLLRGAFATDQGAMMMREFFGSALLGRIVPRLDLPDAGLRVSLAVSHLVGVAVLRYVLGFPALTEASVDELVDALAPRIQTYFTEN